MNTSTRSKPAAAAPDRGQAQASTHRSDGVHPIALWVLLSGTFLVVLDFFIVNVALPSIQRELQASSQALQFVVAGYGLANAACLITAGRLGDMFGRRRMFGWGLLLFTLASAACGLAPTPGLLVAARVLQGVAGALLQPQVLAMLGLLYTGPARARAFAAYGMTLGLGAVGGQLLGGLLIEADLAGLGWRWCFLINLPLGLGAWLLLPRVLPALPGQPGSRLDPAGMGLIALALVAVVFPLVEGRAQGWPAWTGGCLLGAAGLLLAWCWQQHRLATRGGQPLVAPALLGEAAFVRGLLITLAFYAGNASFYFVLALLLQQGLGLGALASGGIFSALALGFFATSLAAPRLGRWLGPRAIGVGALLLAGGHGLQWLALGWLPLPPWPLAGVSGHLAWAVFVLLLTLQGAGVGMVMAPLVSTLLARLPPQHAGVASGVLTTVQQVGNAVGVALIGILFYGQLDQGIHRAFGASLLYLLGLALLVALLWRRMPAPPAS